MSDPEQPAGEPDEHDEPVDELPEDLDVTGYVGPYTFPDNSRRRIPGVIYLVVAAACVAVWATAADDAVLVNDGLLWVGIGLALVGLGHLLTGIRMAIDEKDALVASTREMGFPIGHAAAQMGWRGFASRPTWRILLFSADDPPTKRGLVLIDGVDGEILDTIVEDNPEEPP